MRAIAFQSNTGTSSGISLSSTNAPRRLEATNALYASSDEQLKPAIMSPVASLIVGALALPALAVIPPPNVPARLPLHPAESVIPPHRNYIDPTPRLAWRQYADADDYLYDSHYNRERAERPSRERHERAEHRWHERMERAGHRAERHVKEWAEHMRHEWHEHVDRDYD